MSELRKPDAVRNAETKGQVQDVSVGYKDYTGGWTRGHVCYILAEKCAYILFMFGDSVLD